MLQSVKANNWTEETSPKIERNLFEKINILTEFSLNEATEEKKRGYRILVLTHMLIAFLILVGSIAFFILDLINSPMEGRNNVWRFVIMPVINMLTSFVGLFSTLSTHKYSNSHRMFALIHCVLLCVIIIMKIDYFVMMTNLSQDYFQNFDEVSKNKFWESFLGWFAVCLMVLLLINEILCLLLAYTIRNLGFCFFFIAFLVGKYLRLSFENLSIGDIEERLSNFFRNKQEKARLLMMMEYDHQCSHITRIWPYIFAIVITLFQNIESPAYTYPPVDYRQQAVQLPSAYGVPGFSYVVPRPPPPQINQEYIQEFNSKKASFLDRVYEMQQSRKMAWFIFYNIDRDTHYHTLKNDLALLKKEHSEKYTFNPLFELFFFSLNWFGRYDGATAAFRAALNEMLYFEKFKMKNTPWVVCVNNGAPTYSYPLPFNILDLRAQIDAYLWEQWKLVFFYTPSPMPAVSPQNIPKIRTPLRNIEMEPSKSKSSTRHKVPLAAPDPPPAAEITSTRTIETSKSKSSTRHKVLPEAPEPPNPLRVKARAKTDLESRKKPRESGSSRPVEKVDSKPKASKDKTRLSEGSRDREDRKRDGRKKATTVVPGVKQVDEPTYKRPTVDIPSTDDVPRMLHQQPPPPRPQAQYPPYDPSQYASKNDPYLNQYGSYNPQAPYSAPDFNLLAEINKTAKKIMDTLETAIQRYYVVAILFINMPYHNSPGSKELGDAFDSFIPVANEKGRVYFEKVNMSPFLTMGLNPTMGTFLGNINGWIDGSRKNKPELKSIDAWIMPHLVVFMYHFAEISIQFKTIEDMKDADKKVKGFLESHSIEYKFETDKNKRPPKKNADTMKKNFAFS